MPDNFDIVVAAAGHNSLISGGPGRNASIVMLKEFGRSIAELMAHKRASAKRPVTALAK